MHILTPQRPIAASGLTDAEREDLSRKLADVNRRSTTGSGK